MSGYKLHFPIIMDYKKSPIQILGIVMLLTLQWNGLLAQGQTSRPKPPPMPPTEYFMDSDSDGVYEPIQLENEPIPFQGVEEFRKKFWSLLTYPAMARENRIAGIVTLGVLIDEAGKVVSVEIAKSLSKECDESARKAFIQATTNGFAPLLLNGIPVKYKMEMPVQFWLG